VGNREVAARFYNNGVTVSNDKAHPSNLTTAYQQFVSAVYADPSWSTAAYQAGNNASDLKHLHVAVACYRRALECNPEPEEKARILCNFGWRLQCLGAVDEALAATTEALRLDRKLVNAHVNHAQVLGTLGRTAEGVAAAERAFELDQALEKPDALVEMCLAFQLLFDRQLARGLRHFESRFAYQLHQFLHYPYPKWEGQEGVTLFLVADQGLGDTLSFSRFVSLAARRCAYVHALVQPELMSLFQEAFVGLPNVNLLPSPSPYPVADYWSTFVSLPCALGLSDDGIRNASHIVYKPYAVPAPWKVTDRRLHIGIQWAGSPLNLINEHRSIPLVQFLELYRVPGVQLYSLQMDDSRRQLADHGCAPVMQDLSGFIRDVAGTLSVLRHLDMVICCESALAHICALVGKECWIPYSFLGRDYRIGVDGKDMIWTPKHRIFAQRKGETWEPVFERAVEALRERVEAG
jgi:tetratricopeptide (TPR) repeat protein